MKQKALTPGLNGIPLPYERTTSILSNPAIMAKLYPANDECPSCDYNLRRYRLTHGMKADQWIEQCPMCNADQHGF